MASHERLLLAQAYDEATKAFSQMVDVLYATRRNGHAFAKALSDAEAARDECFRARSAFLDHVAEPTN
jgi:hypothetical protein